MRAMTAFLNPHGTEPSTNKQFTYLVIEGRRILIQSFTRKVGQRSKEQDFVGDSVISLQVSSSETSLNSLKGSGVDSGGRAYSQVPEKPCHNLEIL